MRRKILACAAVVLLTAGCAAAANSSPPSPEDAQAAGPEALAGSGEVDINFWHAMTGKNGDALIKLVDEFNAAHRGKIKVSLQYKGKYDDSLAAYKQATDAQRPDVMQMYDIGSRFMIDSGTTVPVQSFVDIDHWDAKALQPNISGYYTVRDKLWAMPFNTSMPLLYINKQAFTKAGLDPNKPPRTLDEITAAAKKIQASPGHTVKYGFGSTLYGWFFEQNVAVAGGELCNADNGRAGTASAMTLTSPESVKLMTWWQNMAREGLAMPLDNNVDNGDNAFTSGTVAMGLESTGSLTGFLTAAAKSSVPFDVGAAPYPRPAAQTTGGPSIGGAALWVVGKGKSAQQKRASWELLKFLADTDSQVYWHTNTGYFPTVKPALQQPQDQQWVRQKPQFATAITQLRSTPVTKASQGCSVGELPAIRKIVENAMQAIVLQNADVRGALTDAQHKADSLIADYNAKIPR